MLRVVDNFYKDNFKDITDKLHVNIVQDSKTTQPIVYSADSILADVCKFPLENNNHFVVILLIHTN